jgi:hypothetical protein
MCQVQEFLSVQEFVSDSAVDALGIAVVASTSSDINYLDFAPGYKSWTSPFSIDQRHHQRLIDNLLPTPKYSLIGKVGSIVVSALGKPFLKVKCGPGDNFG